jgi:RNA polymerase sigma-70 factor (ECF subfamily)
VQEDSKQARFEELIMPHLDAAYNLARWLTRNEHDAEDVVQDAFLRAFKFFDGFHGSNSRSWLLSIVRNATFDWLKRNRKSELTAVFDEELHSQDAAEQAGSSLAGADQEMVRKSIEELPVEFREVTILRELEGMSYKEIAEITGAPIGTVMSRLARARKQLQTVLTERLRHERTS